MFYEITKNILMVINENQCVLKTLSVLTQTNITNESFIYTQSRTKTPQIHTQNIKKKYPPKQIIDFRNALTLKCS